jgi:hypothetical protein
MSGMADPAADAALGAFLRGEQERLSGADAAHLLEAADRHGVAALLAWKLADAPHAPALRDGLTARARRDAGVALLRQVEAKRVLAALADAGVLTILVKGLPLAFAYYPSPAQRPSLDVDLVVKKEDFETATAVLKGLGYERAEDQGADSETAQAAFVRFDAQGFRHVLDLHWRFSGGSLLAGLPSFEEVAARSIPVPALGPHARTLGAVDALLLACAHRLHHVESDRLIWLYDIALLAATLDEGGWRELVESARARRLASVCLRGLEAAREALGTAVPPGVVRDLSGQSLELSNLLLADERQVWHRVARDLHGMRGWRDRFRLLWRYAFPGREYMKERYGIANGLLLPAAYAYRAVRGLSVPFRKVR